MDNVSNFKKKIRRKSNQSKGGHKPSYEQIELKKMKLVMSVIGVISAELAGKHLTEKGSNATK